MSMCEIGASIGVAATTVFNKLHELGISARPAAMIRGRRMTQRLASLVPRTLPNDIQSEVRQQFAAELISRRIKAREAEQAVPRLIRRAFKECRGDLRALSLDAPITEDGRTWADILEG